MSHGVHGATPTTSSSDSSGSGHHREMPAGGGSGGPATHGRAVFDQARKASPIGSRPSVYRLVRGVSIGRPATSP